MHTDMRLGSLPPGKALGTGQSTLNQRTPQLLTAELFPAEPRGRHHLPDQSQGSAPTLPRMSSVLEQITRERKDHRFDNGQSQL